MEYIETKMTSYIRELVSIQSCAGSPEEMNSFLLDRFKSIAFDNKKNSNHNFRFGMSGTVPFCLYKGIEDEAIVFLVHTDKVGMMVQSNKSSSEFNVSSVGSINPLSLKDERAFVRADNGEDIQGILDVKKDDYSITFKVIEKEKTSLIRSGNYIYLSNAGFEQTGNHIISRFLDNSVCVASALHFLEQVVSTGKLLKKSVVFIFTNREEIANPIFLNRNDFGLEGMKLMELCALDIGVVNENVKETDVSILAKDGGTVYSESSVKKLINIAKEYSFDYGIDVINCGGTDISLLACAGINCKTSSFGPVIANLHGREIIHKESLSNFFSMLCLYILNL